MWQVVNTMLTSHQASCLKRNLWGVYLRLVSFSVIDEIHRPNASLEDSSVKFLGINPDSVDVQLLDDEILLKKEYDLSSECYHHSKHSLADLLVFLSNLPVITVI
jgi:hypothetical protein